MLKGKDDIFISAAWTSKALTIRPSAAIDSIFRGFILSKKSPL
jgi:hypothetical protein